MPRKRAVGAVYSSELLAGEAVRALHHWNRAQRPRPLRGTCVVARRRSGRAKYLPYRVPRARSGAWRGLLIGLFAAGIFGLGAGAAMGAFLDDMVNVARHGADAIVWLLGRGFDLNPTLAQAMSGPLAGAIFLAAGFGLVGAVAGALVGAGAGALGHGARGFSKPMRASVAQQLKLGGATLVAWARVESDEVLMAELRRLGGEPRRELEPAGKAAKPTAPARRSS